MDIRRLRPRAIDFMVILGCAAVLVAGCKSPESQVVGTWTGPGGASLAFKADKSFTQAGQQPVVGKWSLADKKVTVVVESVGGKSPDEIVKALTKMGASADILAKLKEQMKGTSFTLAADGKTMEITGPAGQKVTLTKSETK